MQVVALVVIVLHVLDILVAEEAGLVRRAKHPRPHPIGDHDFVLLLGDSLQRSPKVSDYQHRVEKQNFN